ncbi:MAG TPA: hypothetical protein VFE50_04950 [Cyclobacteriaceae bacterium]|nr:hypothetical protein [Cyclobacteriaceae bacterium]
MTYTLRRIYTTLLLILVVTVSHAKRFTAISNGNWVVPSTWSCKCIPATGDNVIIPQGITVTVTRPIAAQAISLSIAGELELNNGMLQIGEGDKVTVLPGGKVISKGLGGAIYAGTTAHYFENGRVVTGPATIGVKVFKVALMFFEAESAEGHTTLNWASAGEVDVKYYEVLSSNDSITFQPMGEVQGSKYSLRRKDYTFSVGNPASEVEFYRLEAVRADSARVVLSTILAK